VHEVLSITKGFDFQTVDLKLYKVTPARLELTVGLKRTFGLVVCGKQDIFWPAIELNLPL